MVQQYGYLHLIEPDSTDRVLWGVEYPPKMASEMEETLVAYWRCLPMTALAQPLAAKPTTGWPRTSSDPMDPTRHVQ